MPHRVAPGAEALLFVCWLALVTDARPVGVCLGRLRGGGVAGADKVSCVLCAQRAGAYAAPGFSFTYCAWPRAHQQARRVGVGIGLSKSGSGGHVVRRLAAGFPAAECGRIFVKVRAFARRLAVRRAGIDRVFLRALILNAAL